jgi:hypothetical protein
VCYSTCKGQGLIPHSGIVASIIRTVTFATVDPSVDPTFTTAPLLIWTMIEPGLYLIAACALSFKPLFRLVARALHLGQLATYTKSSFRKTLDHRKSNATGAVSTVIRMDNLKSANSGAFTKLREAKDEETKTDLEAGALPKEISTREYAYQKGADTGAISVLVTRTVEVESEHRYGDSDEEEDDDEGMKFNVADQTLFNNMSAGLDKDIIS